jgi:YHS domain-containing protein
MRKMIVTLLVVACGCFLTNSANLAGGEKKVEPKCPVSGKAINKDNKDAVATHNGGTVYFCCEKCPKAFEADSKKFAAKANQQLVITGQAKQVKCVFTGEKLNPDTKIDVSGTPVCFCCGMCKGKAEEKKGAEQVNLIFSDKNFKQGFEVKKAN